MTRFEFIKRGGRYASFKVEGHAGFSDGGGDIVCAAVSSAVQTVINGITDAAKIKSTVSVTESPPEIRLEFLETGELSEAFAKALFMQAELLSNEYPASVRLKLTEE